MTTTTQCPDCNGTGYKDGIEPLDYRGQPDAGRLCFEKCPTCKPKPMTTLIAQQIAERLRQELRDAGLDITWRDNLEPAPDDVVDVCFLDAGLREAVEALEYFESRADGPVATSALAKLKGEKA